MKRRRVLASAGLTLVIGTAGCLDGDSSDGTETDTDGGSTDGDATNSDEGGAESDESASEIPDGPFNPGETIVFFTDPGNAELEFTPSDPSLTSTLVLLEEPGRMMLRQAENGLYLIMAVEVTNSGEETVDVPREVVVDHAGEQYRSLQNTQVGNEYDNFTTLDPGESIERNLVFDVPAAIPPARVTATWEHRNLPGQLPSATAEWELSPDSVEEPGERYDGLPPGESVEVRIGRTGYQVTPQFETTGAGGTVTLNVENTGPELVEDPLEHGVVVVAGDQSFERHPGDEDWPGETGTLEEGGSRELTFAIEEVAAVDRIEVQLTPSTVAVWES